MRIAILLFTILYSSVTLSAQSKKITLLFVGDLMQHQAQIAAARTDSNTYDYSSCFALLKEQIAAADIAIGNLEVTLGGKPYRGYPAFSAPDEFLTAIKEAGFDVLLTANNHCLDRGRKGLERTITLLDSLRLQRAGTYRDSTDRQHRYPLFIHKNGFRIALLNYTYGTNGIRPTPPNHVNYIDRKAMLQDIRTAQAWKPDAIIACLHWGNEYQSLPNAQQKDLADWLFKQGVSHIIGSHPHVIQPMELRTDSLTGQSHVLAYSLGNFISNMSRIHTDGGAMLIMQLEKNDTIGTRPIEVQAHYNLVWTGRPTLTHQKNFKLYPASYPQDSLSAAARNRLKIFTKNTRRLLQKHNVDVCEQRFLEIK